MRSNPNYFTLRLEEIRELSDLEKQELHLLWKTQPWHAFRKLAEIEHARWAQDALEKFEKMIPSLHLFPRLPSPYHRIRETIQHRIADSQELPLEKAKTLCESFLLLDSPAELDFITQAVRSLRNESEEKLKVAFVGEFSAGKSRLINALLGSKILPEGIVPVTCSSIVIEYGEKPSVCYTFLDRKVEAEDFSDLQRFVDQRSLEDDSLLQARIQYPADLLREIDLIDTPGFNSGNFLHDQTAAQLIYDADVIVWVFSGHQIGAWSENQEIKDVHRIQGKIIGVINKIDTIKKGRKWKREEVDRQIERLYNMFPNRFTRIFPVSALWMEKEDPRSGREELIGYMSNIQVEARHKRKQRKYVSLANTIIQIQHHLRQCRNHEDHWLDKICEFFGSHEQFLAQYQNEMIEYLVLEGKGDALRNPAQFIRHIQQSEFKEMSSLESVYLSYRLQKEEHHQLLECAQKLEILSILMSEKVFPDFPLYFETLMNRVDRFFTEEASSSPLPHNLEAIEILLQMKVFESLECFLDIFPIPDPPISLIGKDRSKHYNALIVHPQSEDTHPHQPLFQYLTEWTDLYVGRLELSRNKLVRTRHPKRLAKQKHKHSFVPHQENVFHGGTQARAIVDFIYDHKKRMRQADKELMSIAEVYIKYNVVESLSLQISWAIMDVPPPVEKRMQQIYRSTEEFRQRIWQYGVPSFIAMGLQLTFLIMLLFLRVQLTVFDLGTYEQYFLWFVSIAIPLSFFWTLWNVYSRYLFFRFRALDAQRHTITSKLKQPAFEWHFHEQWHRFVDRQLQEKYLFNYSQDSDLIWDDENSNRFGKSFRTSFQFLFVALVFVVPFNYILEYIKQDFMQFDHEAEQMAWDANWRKKFPIWQRGAIQEALPFVLKHRQMYDTLRHRAESIEYDIVISPLPKRVESIPAVVSRFETIEEQIRIEEDNVQRFQFLQERAQSIGWSISKYYPPFTEHKGYRRRAQTRRETIDLDILEQQVQETEDLFARVTSLQKRARKVGWREFSTVPPYTVEQVEVWEDAIEKTEKYRRRISLIERRMGVSFPYPYSKDMLIGTTRMIQSGLELTTSYLEDAPYALWASFSSRSRHSGYDDGCIRTMRSGVCAKTNRGGFYVRMEYQNQILRLDAPYHHDDDFPYTPGWDNLSQSDMIERYRYINALSEKLRMNDCYRLEYGNLQMTSYDCRGLRFPLEIEWELFLYNELKYVLETGEEEYRKERYVEALRMKTETERNRFEINEIERYYNVVIPLPYTDEKLKTLKDDIRSGTIYDLYSRP